MILLCIDVSAQRRRHVYASSNSAVDVYDIGTDQGYEIWSRDGVLLGYSDHGSYEGVMDNPLFMAMMTVYENNAAVSASSRHRAFGKGETTLIRDRRLYPDYPSSVPNLINALWTQSEPYNRMAPVIDGVHCVTGCVAQAMGCVMRYHRYPEHGYGSHTYIDILGSKDTLTSDFERHYYDWDNMLDVYREGEYSHEQADAIAQLMYDCGVSVEMRYGIRSSAARSVFQPIALTKYFGYDRGMQMYFRDFYSWDEWEDMLRGELSAGRPILLSAMSATLSHAFICDGYDDEGLYHIIWGNGVDTEDGYYNFQYLSPNQPQWYDRNSPERGVNLLQYMTIGVQPDKGNPEVHSFGLAGIDCVEGKIVTRDLCNIGWNEHDDSVAVALKRDDRIVDILYTYQHEFLLEELFDTAYTDTVQIKTPPVADGIYRIVPVYKDGGEWREARTSMGTPNHLLALIDGGKWNIKSDESAMAHLTLVDYTLPDTMVNLEKPQYSITITNDSRTEYCGRIYLRLYTSPTSPYYIVLNQQGLTIRPGETIRRDFKLTPLNSSIGTFYLRLYYDNNLLNDSLTLMKNFVDDPIVVVPTSIDDVQVDEASDKADEVVVYSVSGVAVMRRRGYTVEDVLGDDDLPSGVWIINGKKYVKG